MFSSSYKYHSVPRSTAEWYQAEIESRDSYIKDLRKQVKYLQEQLVSMSKYYYAAKEKEKNNIGG